MNKYFINYFSGLTQLLTSMFAEPRSVPKDDPIPGEDDPVPEPSEPIPEIRDPSSKEIDPAIQNPPMRAKHY